MKIVVTENISEGGLEVLRETGWEVAYLPDSRLPLEQALEKEIVQADGLVIRSATRVTPLLLEQSKKLQAIGRAGVGVDNIDVEAATRRGILVMNTPGGNAVSVAEHTMALLMTLARDIPKANSLLKQGKWAKKGLTGVELRGKVLGLVGLGRVGLEVARRAKSFGMKILAYDPYVSPRIAEDQEVRLKKLDEVLAESDFLSLHAALTPETQHLVNSANLAKMKPSIRLVNCARGELVNEAELLEAIDSGRVAGAGLDVFEIEPPAPGSAGAKLLEHPRVVATPHIAGSTEEAQEVVGLHIAQQLRDYLRDGIVRNAVNLPSLSAEEFKKLEPYVELGDKLGAFLAQISGGRMNRVSISYDGGLAEVNTRTVRNAVLKGVLNVALAEKANLVNAGTLAEERGLEVEELRSRRRINFSNSLGVALQAEGVSPSILGMVGMNGGLRILGINDIDIEVPLKGNILFIQNKDVPGVIGRIGTILGAAQINIANFALGRGQDNDQALGVINVDHDVPKKVLVEIGDIPAVNEVRLIRV